MIYDIFTANKVRNMKIMLYRNAELPKLNYSKSKDLLKVGSLETAKASLRKIIVKNKITVSKINLCWR